MDAERRARHREQPPAAIGARAAAANTPAGAAPGPTPGPKPHLLIGSVQGSAWCRTATPGAARQKSRIWAPPLGPACAAAGAHIGAGVRPGADDSSPSVTADEPPRLADRWGVVMHGWPALRVHGAYRW
jgi:hypothetical protein